MYTDFARVETYEDFRESLGESERELEGSAVRSATLAALIAETACFGRYHGYQN